MARAMKRISVITLLLTICFYFLHQITRLRIWIPFAVTFGTTAYHFIIRLLVGVVVDKIMQNKADYQKRWYQVSDFEMKLYQKMIPNGSPPGGVSG